MQNLKAALATLPKDAEWAGLREVREVLSHRVARDARPEQSHSWTTHGVMAEVLHQGQFGYAATADLSPSGLKSALAAAAEQARAAASFAVNRFEQTARPPVHRTSSSSHLQPLLQKTPAEVMGRLVEMCGWLKTSPKIVRTEAFALTAATQIRFATSSC